MRVSPLSSWPQKYLSQRLGALRETALREALRSGVDGCRFAAHYRPGDAPPVPRRTFSKHWEQRCEHSWRYAFGAFSLGVPCFLVRS